MILEHKHLIVRAEINHPPQNPRAMDEWMRHLVEDIQMKVLMGPFSIYSDMPGNQGLTSVTIIETSHIAVHVWDEVSPALMQMDVYSCSDFEPQLIFDRLYNDFGAVKVEWKFLDRERGLEELPVNPPLPLPIPDLFNAVA